MNFIPTSAHETFEARGYSPEETRRVRGFMPRRFGNIGPALPLTNIEFWLAYECVKHYSQNSSERGRFFASEPIDFRYNGTIEYRSRTLNERFSMTEFLRHFGDILYTNFNAELDMKEVKRNPDGSLVIKNRIASTRLVEIQKQAEYKEEYVGFRVNRAEYQVGRLTLPYDGDITPALLLKVCFHGQLIQEFINTNGGRQLNQQVDFNAIALYLYTKRFYNKQDKQFGEDFESERRSITMTMNFRTAIGYYNPEASSYIHAFHIKDGDVMTKDGIKKTFPDNSGQYPWYPILYRHSTNGNKVAILNLPLSVYAEFTPEEWAAALA